MEPILARCGYRCDLCLAHRPDVERRPADRAKLSDGWITYFGFRIAPEKNRCDGCLAEHPHLIDSTCPVRPCVLERGLENCSLCGEYICGKLKERIVVREDAARRAGMEIPEDDYRCFILPYENFLRLRQLRKTAPETNRREEGDGE